MALLGKAAMILSFDVAPEAMVEHDDWHSHEHFHERMSIPGFLRGSRWVALSGEPNYFVMYEVADLDVLASPPYLERLNNPSRWTSKMMTQYHGMKRGFCRITCSHGEGLGQTGVLIRFSPEADKESTLRDWLNGELLSTLPSRPGLVSAYLFEAALQPGPTAEQRIRGKDAAVAWVLLVTGYDAGQVANIAAKALSVEELQQHGASGVVWGIYQMVHSLSDREAVTHCPNS